MLAYICCKDAKTANGHMNDVNGHTPFCPHTSFWSYFQEEDTKRHSLAMLERCDVVFVFGERDEWMNEQIEYANRIGVQVVHDVPAKLIDEQIEHTNRIGVQVVNDVPNDK